MAKEWKIQNGFGLSWGIAGLRIGKNQYGSWWISVALPLGFRVTKYITDNKKTADGNPMNIKSKSPQNKRLIAEHLTENQKILEKIKKQTNS
jgi:hypothetical protein